MNVSTSSSPRDTENSDYQQLVTETRSVNAWPLFTTSAANLYDLFLNALAPERRQHYVCRTCRKFVEKYGGLVTIGEDGVQRSLLWSGVDDLLFFRNATRELRQTVIMAKVTGVFLSSEPVWGVASNTALKSQITWHHLHVQPSTEMMRREGPLKTSEQVMAEKHEDHGILCRGLVGYPLELVRQAHTLLTTGALYRSEKCIGIAKWLLDLHESLAATKHKVVRENLIWRAVALAPPGYVHIKSTMIGTLLEDLTSEKPIGAIINSFNEKMSPIQYQRPSAKPTDGQLAAAESVVAKLASAGSLQRRFATLEEILPHAIWVPKVKADAPPSSVFGHLKSNGGSPTPIDIPAQPMTWDKFSWTVLPNVEKLEFLVPGVLAPFFAFVTAVNPDAPPILQWDSVEKRNPVSWYLYNNGSYAHYWGLTVSEFCEVTAVTLQPSAWGYPASGVADTHHGEGAYLILQNARDKGREQGLALFPECLKSDYRGIRHAIEAYSKSRHLEGKESSTACGIALQKSAGTWNQVVRVTVQGARVLYRLDRWD